ncbi:MaoC/PaaZ C-terminal domain-containing protein [Halosolutus gelatinilyticus]|uniref:MaoC/PaaZ C-terminal domain-containing protein n=1 Tax=Halosolutus gelatinilyticus TaxID=2931975 RepID=UPI001FF3C951|nr:MaoC/PaaZ C-terminal domain-containing protein [Halosolutus gelatinilyticus]
MDVSLPPTEGDEYTYERTFDPEDVRAFGELSGDQQAIHTDPDEDGRLIVQGLLTATLPTKIGGDMSYIARIVELEFYRPVFTGETIACTMVVESVAETDDRYEVECSGICTNEADEVVMDGTFDGIVRKDGTDGDDHER